tara:strand:+ start:12830 stop:13060 length:231 start_codon:yes stop_codon:yes gene_type:complete
MSENNITAEQLIKGLEDSVDKFTGDLTVIHGEMVKQTDSLIDQAAKSGIPGNLGQAIVNIVNKRLENALADLDLDF